MLEYVDITRYLADLLLTRELREIPSKDASFLSGSRIVKEVSKDSLLWQ
jgi:hypothetical protein